MKYETGEAIRDCSHKLQMFLDTLIYHNGKIEMTLRDSERELSKWVMDTREQAIKDALIKLGWTPP